jgi:hypothetical protein
MGRSAFGPGEAAEAKRQSIRFRLFSGFPRAGFGGRLADRHVERLGPSGSNLGLSGSEAYGEAESLRPRIYRVIYVS